METLVTVLAILWIFSAVLIGLVAAFALEKRHKNRSAFARSLTRWALLIAGSIQIGTLVYLAIGKSLAQAGMAAFWTGAIVLIAGAFCAHVRREDTGGNAPPAQMSW